ncbi:MAG: BadF/BadG/BcrA/BcrD ATPase family protein [Ignavibacteria bacterium]|nr:BadF/BadG/BcrA/BcrD ATPase family protein [Ignavibacteria bacterium]
MSYLIGIDGGGTKTHAVLTNLNDEKLFECFGGPSNFLILGTGRVAETLLALIDSCKNYLNISYNDISFVLLGTTGAGRRSDAELLENDFQSYLTSKNISIRNFRVESDARIALEGAFSGKPGSILIAGTGSIMFGKDKDGNIHRVGGFGRYIGDEGSGYSIGKKALTAIAKSFDGRGKKTILSELIAEKFGIVSSEKLITEVYKNNFDVASVTPLVLQAVEIKDGIAVHIIESETDELILHLKAMEEKIKEDVLSVAFIGGILSSKNVYSELFAAKINKQVPNCRVKLPDYPPEYGAILMAQTQLNNNKG